MLRELAVALEVGLVKRWLGCSIRESLVKELRNSYYLIMHV